MAIFKLQDGTRFYQWDVKRKLVVTDDRIDQVHFTNKTLNNAIVRDVYAQEGSRLVDVPAYLLECDCNITAYAYIMQEDKEFTLVHEVFGVTPRKQPDDYVVEEHVEKWSELDKRISALEKAGVIKVGENLKLSEDGTLSVDTVNNVEEDNTKPVTSAAVYVQLGNVEALLHNI